MTALDQSLPKSARWVPTRPFRTTVRLLAHLQQFCKSPTPNVEDVLAKTARQEAARQSVDRLLR